MRTELDRIAENNYAREQGLKQGLAEGREEVLTYLRTLGVPEEKLDEARKYLENKQNES